MVGLYSYPAEHWTFYLGRFFNVGHYLHEEYNGNCIIIHLGPCDLYIHLGPHKY